VLVRCGVSDLASPVCDPPDLRIDVVEAHPEQWFGVWFDGNPELLHEFSRQRDMGLLAIFDMAPREVPDVGIPLPVGVAVTEKKLVAAYEHGHDDLDRHSGWAKIPRRTMSAVASIASSMEMPRLR